MVCELSPGKNNKKQASRGGLKILEWSYKETEEHFFSKRVKTAFSLIDCNSNFSKWAYICIIFRERHSLDLLPQESNWLDSLSFLIRISCTNRNFLVAGSLVDFDHCKSSTFCRRNASLPLNRYWCTLQRRDFPFLQARAVQHCVPQVNFYSRLLETQSKKEDLGNIWF